MKTRMEQALAEAVHEFRLPQYSELPDMGLYLEQTTKYINQCLEPMGCVLVTGSMIRNYVKMGLVQNPVKKQYYARHIAHLICITILKSVMSLDHVRFVFGRQKQVYSDETAYNYFCMELENVLNYRFGVKSDLAEVGNSVSEVKTMLRSAIDAFSHMLYLNACFAWLEKNSQDGIEESE